MLRRSLVVLIGGLLVLGIAASGVDLSLVVSTYFGGSRGDGGYVIPIVCAPNGDIFVAFRADSSDVVVSSTAPQPTYSGRGDIVIARMNSDLSELLSATYLGGTGEEGPWPSIDMVVSKDAVFVAFATGSINLPTTEDAVQPARRGDFDIGIARLSLDLSEIEACTYLGGSDDDGYVSVGLTPEGNVVVVGSTLSRNFPKTEDYPAGLSGGRTVGDVFVSVLSPDLSQLIISRLLPGASDDVVEGFAVMPNGDLLLGGWTRSTDFAPSEGSPEYLGGMYDGFVVKLFPSLEIAASVFVGGSDWDFVYSLAVSSDRIAIAGHTASLDLATTSGTVQRAYAGDGGADDGDDVFVMVLDHSLAIISATYLGGDGWENATALAASDAGWIVAGQTNSTHFAGNDTSFAPQGANKYATEGFLAALNHNLTQADVIRVGGSGVDCPGGLAVASDGDLLLLMGTTSTDLPTSANALQPEHAGGSLSLATMIWGGDLWIGRYSAP